MSGSSTDRPSGADPARDRELEIQRFLTSVGIDLMRTPPSQIEASIAEALRCAGRFLGGQQAHLRLTGLDDETVQSISVCSDPTAPSPEEPGWLADWTTSDWWREQLDITPVVTIPDAGLHAESAVRDNLVAGGIGAVVALAIRDETGARGIIAIQSPQPQPTWLQPSLKPMAALADLIDGAVRRRMSRDSLIEARQEAERATKAKSEFLANMSHELRTPMNAILGFAQLLNDSPSTSEDDHECVSEILHAGEHLLKLINEVLDLAKIEAGRADLTVEQVKAGPIAEECAKLVRPLAAMRNIELTVSIADRTPVLADHSRLRQSLLNLLSNAIKYCRPGGRVSVKIERHGASHMRIAVSDTGIGMSDAQIARLFEPFCRLAPGSDGTEGTGIGLTITKLLVDLMGGFIDVESAPEQGSTFTLTLPSAPAAKAGGRPQRPSRDREATNPSEGLAACHVLYIEDQPANRRLVEQLFNRPGGPSLSTEETVEGGLQAMRNHPPQLMLVDISLPDGDGYEVLKQVKADPNLRSIPVLAVTAHAMPGDAERGMSAGFDDYITKPIEIDTFLATVDRWLSATIEPARQTEEASAQ